MQPLVSDFRWGRGVLALTNFTYFRSCSLIEELLSSSWEVFLEGGIMHKLPGDSKLTTQSFNY